MKALILLLILAGTAAADDYRVINTTDVPDDIGGTSKPHAFSLIATLVICLFGMTFGARHGRLGVMMVAGSTTFFKFIGWLPIQPLHLLMVDFLAILYVAYAGRNVQ